MHTASTHVDYPNIVDHLNSVDYLNMCILLQCMYTISMHMNRSMYLDFRVSEFLTPWVKFTLLFPLHPPFHSYSTVKIEELEGSGCP